MCVPPTLTALLIATLWRWPRDIVREITHYRKGLQAQGLCLLEGGWKRVKALYLPGRFVCVAVDVCMF